MPNNSFSSLRLDSLAVCVCLIKAHFSERLAKCHQIRAVLSKLGQSRFLSGDIAPFLDHGLLDLSGVRFGPGADLLGDIHALLSGLELGDKLGHVGTSSLGLKRALFLGGILDNSLGLVIADLSTLLESTTSGGTQLPGLLGTSGDGGVLLHVLLLDAADLSGPLGALGEGGVSRGLISTLLILNSLALDDVILNIVLLLLGPALRFVLSSADLRSLDITVLDEGSSAHLDGLVEGDLLVVDETVLSEVLLALLLLLGLVVGDVGGVTPPVVGVVALHHIVVLCLLHHLHLVNTPLTVSTRSSSCYSTKVYCYIITLTLSTAVKRGGSVVMVFMVLVVLLLRTVLLVEGEGASEGPGASLLVVPQLASS